MEKTINYLFENLAFYLTIILLVFIPLYPKFPLFEIFGTYIAVRLEDFVLAAAFALWAIVYFRNPKEFLNNSLNRAIILFLAIGAVSLFSGLYLTKSVEEPHLGFLHYLRRVEYFLPFFIAVTAIRKREHLNSAVVILGIVVAATAVYGVGQKLFSWPVISTMNREFSKGLYLILTPDAQLNSTFAGHYDLAAFTAMMLPLFVILFIDRKRIFVKIICFLLTGTLFWLLLASASRISFAAAFVGILSAFWISSRKKFAIPAIIFAVILLFTGKDLLARFAQTWYSLPSTVTAKFPLGEKIAQRFVIQRTHPGYKIDPEIKGPATATGSAGKIAARKEKEEDRSSSIRLNAEWPRAMKAFYKNPVLGTGYSSITLATDNDYLRLLGEVGILGILGFILILANILKRIWFFLKETPLSQEKTVIIGVTSGLIAFLANAFLIDIFEASKVAIIFWILAGLTISYINFEEKKCS